MFAVEKSDAAERFSPGYHKPPARLAGQRSIESETVRASLRSFETTSSYVQSHMSERAARYSYING